MIDLANEVIRETYRPDSLLGQITASPPDRIRRAIENAKRFILDADMSEMLGHLATTPYEMCKPEKRGEVLSSQRRSARLPFGKIFVQYDGRAFRRGLLAATGNKLDLWGKELIDTPDSQVIDPIGWLMERIPNTGIVFVTEFLMNEKRAATIPIGWAWNTEDIRFEDMKIYKFAEPGVFDMLGNCDVDAAGLAHGVTGHHDPSTAVVYLNEGGKAAIPPSMRVDIRDADTNELVFYTHYMVAEGGGALRYMFAFLNMLNEVPVSYERPRRTSPYLANGKRRVALETQVIRLILPNRTITYRDYARQLSRGVLKRAAHPVRGHWRVYGPKNCASTQFAHEWGPTDPTGHSDCMACTASRTWINDYRTKGEGATGKVYSVGARS